MKQCSVPAAARDESKAIAALQAACIACCCHASCTLSCGSYVSPTQPHDMRAGLCAVPQADLCLCLQMHHLGYYEHEKDAARAYDIAVRRLRGRNAPTNLPPRPGRPPAAIKLPSPMQRPSKRGRGPPHPAGPVGTAGEEEQPSEDREDGQEVQGSPGEQDGDHSTGGNKDATGPPGVGPGRDLEEGVRIAGRGRGRGRGIAPLHPLPDIVSCHFMLSC